VVFIEENGEGPGVRLRKVAKMSEGENVVSLESRLLEKAARKDTYYATVDSRTKAVSILAIAVRQMRELKLSSRDISRLFRLSADVLGDATDD
jgi:hypothetical protein